MSIKYNEINISSQEDYFKRINSQIEWFDKKSISYKRKYLLIKIIILILTSSITITSALSASNGVISQGASIIIIILAPTIAFLETILQLFQFEKLYYLYRTTSEKLIQTKINYQTIVNCNDRKGYFASFVENCERILLDNNLNWRLIKNPKEATKQD